MATISHNSIIAYFKDLQEKLIGLEDFFRIDLAEIKGAFRSDASFPCLVVESHESDLGKSKPNQSVNDRTFAFTVYFNPENGNFDEQNEMLDLSEAFGYKIIARMRHDATIKNHILFNRFKVSEVKNHKVGPVFNERLYGYRFTGEITAQQPLIVSPDDWTDIDLICS
ncbi:hypothetical protein Leef1_3 [Polaribacter phage Leef_1]|uniref:Uncharacterized protein n=1 Tax=Polaribacter phage Leef_1 TaxID=2745684 RepID=A0A8E4ZGE4_9CAUD|nr:hypothetical protein M1M28_gp03 [Polaribacter phage Leef_1]QQV91394.1 hypothetical protein Leef1_3 [Polaribacter phage Leef_1]